ncbi:MAG: DUF1257 domain-containing protein [Cyanobium sp.]
MSHLTILPTVLRDADQLAAALDSLGLDPQRGGSLPGFSEEQQPVELSVQLPDGQRIGWQRCRDGSLGLVCDLQRASRSRNLQPLLGRLTRAYAARQALAAAAVSLPTAQIEVSA